MMVLPWPGRNACPAPSSIDRAAASSPTPRVRWRAPTRLLNAVASRFRARTATPATGSVVAGRWEEVPAPGVSVMLPVRTSSECDPAARRQRGDPFTDTHARDYTIRDYRSHLITDRQAKPASVNLTLAALAALAALDHFYRFLGLGPARVRREDLPQAAPRALSVEETRRLFAGR